VTRVTELRGASQALRFTHRAAVAQMASEDRRNRLVEARDQLSNALQSCESVRDLPALSREYRAVLSELDSLAGEEVTSVVDQLAERRDAKDSVGARRSS
jgi:hypothetical protein